MFCRLLFGISQESCCLRCIFLPLEFSEMIALFHLAIALSLVWFMALVSTNVFLSKCCPHNSTVLCTGTSNDKTLNCQWSKNCNPFIGTLATESLSLGFSEVRVTRSLVLCVMLCRMLFVPLSFFFCPLYCLSFYLRILIAPLSSSSSFL